ncbi:MAG: 2,3-bisphosphoglycerate-independent phosphoglycerate mutase [Opitutales bacterium]|nr:2,3-bisphosphoglycerate-independent phosphoglycerate mutase [Opitutales bacterium]
MDNDRHPVVLIIRDGWGCNHEAKEDKVNALKLAKIPFSNRISQEYPRTEIYASGLSVGLPDGVMGNSEVGHQNIGAGRVVDQEIVRIDKAIHDGSFYENPTLLGAIQNAKKHGSKLHLFGLCSNGGVHSVLGHLFAFLKCAKMHNLQDVYIHVFSDGRDTPQNSGIQYLSEIEKQCKEIGVGKIASVIGRFWAMDRDKRWTRVEKAYKCLVGDGECDHVTNPRDVFEQYYSHPVDGSMIGDEFIPPTRILDPNGDFVGKIQDNDSVIFFNFRGDRPREITHAFIDDNFSEFKRIKKLKLYYATLTEYESGLVPNIIFPRPPKMKNILGQYISDCGFKQFRCAETEKYAHVTFFFNDYREEPFPGEERVLIPSPRDVKTYDEKPEMSAYGVKDSVVNAILSKKYDLIVVNFANPDMIGHTGNLPAAIRAAEVVDECVKEILTNVDATDGSALVTADHGNLERMVDLATGKPHTQHTTNPVEVVLYGQKYKNAKLRDGGCLADIAPTILELLGVSQPAEMTGQSLIRHER